MFNPAVQGPYGLSIAEERRRVIARGRAFSKGEVGQFDIGRDNAATTNTLEGDPNSCFTNVVAVTAAGAKRFPQVLFLEDVGQNQAGWALLSGVFDEADLADTVAAGAALMASSANNKLNAAVDDGAKVLAVALEAISSGGSGKVLFDGQGILGVHVN